MSRCKVTEEHLLQLKGYTIKDIVLDEGDGEFGESFYGLLLVKGKTHKVAFIQSDPEGNGPGHLHIQGWKP